jgi:hypothetical protein
MSMNIERFSPAPEACAAEAPLQRFHVDGPAERLKGPRLVGVVELLHADRQHDVVKAGGHHGAGLVQRRGRTRARVLDVHHRDASDAHRAQHDLAADAFLPGDDAGGRVADPRGLEIGSLDPRVRERRRDGLAAERFQPLVEMSAEGRHADARHVCVELHDVLLSPTARLTGALAPSARAHVAGRPAPLRDTPAARGR